MKRIFFIILFTLFTLAINAGVEVMCDVIYKDKDGNWSDFYRTKVTFCLGHEINQVLESRSPFGVIWFSQSQCAVLKLKDALPSVNELDLFGTFMMLCSNDMINTGIDCILQNGTEKQEWKIYPKDEIGLLIDSRLSSTDYGTNYNQGTLRNRNNGTKIDREKPKDAPKHEGIEGTIVYKDQWLFYIVQVKDKFLAMERTDCTIIKSELKEILIGDFNVPSSQHIYYNKSRDIDGYRFNVLKSFDNYQECEKFVKSKWPY